MSRTYAYDVAGSLVEKSGPTNEYEYSYDPWGRMTGAQKDTDAQGGYDATVSYSLDVLGRTTSRTSTGEFAKTTNFALRGTSEQIATATTGGATVSYAYNASGSPIAQGAAGAAEFFTKNPHGDVIGSVSATSQMLTGTVSYSPYGERRSGTGQMDKETEKAKATVLGFQGQPTDPTTGLVDANTRMYDPSMGRFTTIDSVFGELKNPMSLNQYVYGLDNPITMTDPSGMSATWAEYRSDMRAYSAALKAWQARNDAYQFYLDVTLPNYAADLEAWTMRAALHEVAPEIFQVPGPMPKRPTVVPPPGPMPTPPQRPPVIVVVGGGSARGVSGYPGTAGVGGPRGFSQYWKGNKEDNDLFNGVAGFDITYSDLRITSVDGGYRVTLRVAGYESSSAGDGPGMPDYSYALDGVVQTAAGRGAREMKLSSRNWVQPPVQCSPGTCRQVDGEVMKEFTGFVPAERGCIRTVKIRMSPAMATNPEGTVPIPIPGSVWNDERDMFASMYPVP